MDTIWQTAINGDVFKNLEHQIGVLGFSEFNIILLENNIEDLNFLTKNTTIADEKGIEQRLLTNIYIEFKDKIIDYLTIFDNTKSFFYLSKLIDLCKIYNPSIRYNELYLTFENVIEKHATFQEYFNENYSHLDEKTIKTLKEYVFEVIYSIYLKNYLIFENYINDTYKDFRKGKINKNLFEINQIILKNNPVFNIDKKYDVSDIRSKSNGPTSFDPVVTAILFDYLKEKKVILNFNYTSLAKLINLATFSSERNLRTILSNIVKIEVGDHKNLKKYNEESTLPYETLKELLNSILIDVEIQINIIKNIKRNEYIDSKKIKLKN